MTPEATARIVAAIGDEAKDFTPDQLGDAAAKFIEDAVSLNEELSAEKTTLTNEKAALETENGELKAKVTELSAAVAAKDTIELSASTKTLISTNLDLRIDAIAKEYNWSTADTNEAKAVFKDDTLIGLSAAGIAGGDDKAVKLLGLLAKRPTAALKTGQERSGPQPNDGITQLSRNASDDGQPKPSTENPLLKTAETLAGK